MTIYTSLLKNLTKHHLMEATIETGNICETLFYQFGFIPRDSEVLSAKHEEGERDHEVPFTPRNKA